MAEESSNDFSWLRLRHFLYLGTEGTCYMPAKQKFQKCTIHSIEILLNDSKGPEVVKEIVKFAKEGWTVCSEALIYALAICVHSNTAKTQEAAFKALKDVCSTAESLLIFNRFLGDISRPTSSGWGRARRRAVSNWYNSQSSKTLASQVTKHISRHCWTHRDIIRLAHVKPSNAATSAVFKYITKGWESCEQANNSEDANDETKDVLNFLKAAHELKHATDEQKAARLIEAHNLSFEHIPTTLLKSKEVWSSLISRLPLPLLLQQLSRLNRLSYLKHNSILFKQLIERLRNENTIADVHVGPIETFMAQKHMEGPVKGLPGNPIPIHRKHSHLDEALTALHFNSFKMVPSTGKRYLVAVDVRNPMVFGKSIGCSAITPADATALLLMALSRAENQNLTAVAFSMKGMVNIDVNNKMTMMDIARRMRETPMGPVNIAAPLNWAKENKRHYDIFIVCTDTQTQIVDIHPAEALKDYRRTMNLEHSKLVVCAFSSRGFSLSPPDEPGMLDIAGFSHNLLQIVQDYARGIF